MKKCILIALLLIGFSSSNEVVADSATTKFSICLVDTLNGKERKELAKWIFFAIAAHPEIKEFSKISSEDKKASDQFLGKLISRLLMEDCPTEFKEAYKETPMALEKGFQYVGQVAMQELMTNEDTVESITSYLKYVDIQKVTKFLNSD